jgi:hypothetical protein
MRHHLLIALALSLLALVMAPAAPGLSQDEGYPLEVGATSCQEAPPTLAPPQLAQAGCGPAPGVKIAVQGEGGQPLGTCVTEAAAATDPVASCTVVVPFDTPVYASVVEATLPSDVALLERELFERTPPRDVAGYPPQFFIAVPATQASPPTPLGAETAIALRTFTCPPR